MQAQNRGSSTHAIHWTVQARAVAALAAVIALTVTGVRTHGATTPGNRPTATPSQGDGGLSLPKDIEVAPAGPGHRPGQVARRRVAELGPKDWLRKAGDFVNPVIEDLWKPERMRRAKEPQKTVPHDVAADQGVTDPAPDAVQARPIETPYHSNAPAVGKLFFDGPEGLHGLLGHGREGPGAPRQVQPGLDGRALRARGQGRRLVPQHRLRARPTTTSGMTRPS